MVEMYHAFQHQVSPLPSPFRVAIFELCDEYSYTLKKTSVVRRSDFRRHTGTPRHAGHAPAAALSDSCGSVLGARSL